MLTMTNSRKCHLFLLFRIVTFEQVPVYFVSGHYSFQALGHEHKCFYLCLTFDMFAGDWEFTETVCTTRKMAFGHKIRETN
ncbi:hypothetical protein FF1_042092 [Malus domestica]